MSKTLEVRGLRKVYQGPGRSVEDAAHLLRTIRATILKRG